MLLGFISLLLTVGQGPISSVCISKKIGATWHPCNKNQETAKQDEKDEITDSDSNRRKLLTVLDSGTSFRRILASAEGSTDKCVKKVCIPSFISSYT
jgi:mlo protein